MLFILFIHLFWFHSFIYFSWIHNRDPVRLLSYLLFIVIYYYHFLLHYMPYQCSILVIGCIWVWYHINGLAQDCGNSGADAQELPQSCSEPSVYCNTLYPEYTVLTRQWATCFFHSTVKALPLSWLTLHQHIHHYYYLIIPIIMFMCILSCNILVNNTRSHAPKFWLERYKK